jgi:carbamoyltransferase
LEHVYWGPEFPNDEVKQLLDARHLQYRYEEDIPEVTAQLLAENKIIAWFQGRMESGPRALGGRSILMSPTRAENKDIINARVKFREGFRPFCPSMLAETATDYLRNARAEGFMITSFDVRPEKRLGITAVVHVDGTVRPQTVNRDVNERYWKLIKAFGDRTGEYVLLNTSLNIKNEPIVCHPREAIRCFYDTGLDYLVIGNFIVSKC